MMKKYAILAVFGAFLGGFLLAALALRPRPATVEVVQRGPSASTTITLCLFGTVALLTLGAGLVAAVSVWAKMRQNAQRMEQTAMMLQARQAPTMAQRQQRRPQIGAGPSVVILSNGQNGPQVEDLRQ